jgi:Rrf2 family protein
MSANSNFAVAVHILTLLAVSDEALSSSEIAGSVNTNPVTIRKMAGALRDAGLIDTIPGSTGGMTLRRRASQITLGDVYRVVQDESIFGMHPNTPNPNCPVGRNIQAVLGRVFEDTDHLILKALAQVSIQDMLDEVQAREQAH